MKSKEDKTNGVADQGIPVAGDNVDNAGGHLTLDGSFTDSDPVYHSQWPIDDPSFPWVQVKMDKNYYVKGVRLSQRSSWGSRHTHKEVTLTVVFL